MGNASPRELDAQYRTPANLAARASLHQRFGTNPHPWTRWLFDQLLAAPPDAAILELGCGAAELWRQNLDRIPPGWRVQLSDRSPGMVAAARAALGDRCAYATIDAQAIPLPAASVEVVIANHMLYHVPDQPRALAEIRRVLRPGGWLFAATNGAGHMRELFDLAAKLPVPARGRWRRLGQSFSLENAPARLAPYFTAIQIERHAGELIVPEAVPLVDYIYSMASAARGPSRWVVNAARPLFARWVARVIARGGPLHIRQDGGLVIARAPGGE